MTTWDAVVIGSGPNGLAAAITVARAGRSVLVIERAETPGGGMRTEELTLPGFRHDICSAIHPLGKGSPFFRQAGLEAHGLHWVEPELTLAHPLPGGRAAFLARDIGTTAEGLGRDGTAYRRLIGPLASDWDRLAPAVLAPILRPPRHPLALARFGIPALAPATTLARSAFRDDAARALFTGLCGHAITRLDRPLTAAFGLVLGAAGHALGWPVARGGSQAIAEAMVGRLRELGGELEVGRDVRSLDDLPAARAVFADVMPGQLARLAGDRLAMRERRKLQRYAHAPGIFKLDYALSQPLPWMAEVCRRAGTVHVGGTMEEVAAAEREVALGRHPERPYVVVGQQSLTDGTRAPAGKHTLWAYCHVPYGSTTDMTEHIEAQIERFAPGFRDVVLARRATDSAALGRHNPNMRGGDIAGGSNAGLHALFRPRLTPFPYRTAIPGIYLCSSATPPGGGVHGMCGFHAARDALRRELR